MQQGNIVTFRENLEEAALRRAAERGGKPADGISLVWLIVRREAARDAAAEPLLSSFLHACILSHGSFEEALAFVLSKRLASPCFLATELFELFASVFARSPHIVEAAIEDVRAVYQRDPATTSYSHALLHYKGFHAVEAHRIANDLWTRGERAIASALQSRMSEVFAADIHPGARFGKGILLDHGTGVVIGETVVVGDYVSILQNVTLGGTGKEDGDRHPKISDNVLIGASARILGNIRIGRSAQVAAGSTVLREVPPRTLVAGAPAREIGAITGNPALDMDQIQADTQIEAVTSERAARRKWKGAAREPPEYLI
ncbi:serine O-acetyltransferase [Chlorella sorokiniana]|uniref:serine O-acetyltransferase n=1 Tax=Chlorella sorokiniana TaxID=3076 RepID=A0A2P6TKI2_CHLSO|nr:serine O-acetyltransferase [Chlorella sorokiniana]|eukprot:PRW44585.1 serine O-acetyltransferase [Chlorella sorokiniana]